jgi:hypothetical protein
MPVCSSCLKEDHSGHRIISIQDGAEQDKERIESFVRDLSARLRAFEADRIEIESKLQGFQDWNRKLLDQIDLDTDSLIAMIKKRRDESKADLNRRVEETIVRRQEQIDVLSVMIRDGQRATAFAERVLGHGWDAEIVETSNSIVNSLQTFDRDSGIVAADEVATDDQTKWVFSHPLILESIAESCQRLFVIASKPTIKTANPAAFRGTSTASFSGRSTSSASTSTSKATAMSLAASFGVGPLSMVSKKGTSTSTFGHLAEATISGGGVDADSSSLPVTYAFAEPETIPISPALFEDPSQFSNPAAADATESGSTTSSATSRPAAGGKPLSPTVGTGSAMEWGTKGSGAGDLSLEEILKASILQKTFIGGVQGPGRGQLNSPRGLALEISDGSSVGSGASPLLYVADQHNHRVQVFDILTGQPVRGIGLGKGNGPGYFNGPYDIALLPASPTTPSLLFVSDNLNHRIQIFNAGTGNFLKCIGGKGSGNGMFNFPRGIALLYSTKQATTSNPRDIFLYVADSWNDRIQVFSVSIVGDTSCSFVRAFGGKASAFKDPHKLTKPSSVCVFRDRSSKDPLVYVSDDSTHRVFKYTLKGEYAGIIDNGIGPGQASLEQPDGVVVVQSAQGTPGLYRVHAYMYICVYVCICTCMTMFVISVFIF